MAAAVAVVMAATVVVANTPANSFSYVPPNVAVHGVGLERVPRLSYLGLLLFLALEPLWFALKSPSVYIRVHPWLNLITSAS